MTVDANFMLWAIPVGAVALALIAKLFTHYVMRKRFKEASGQGRS